MNKTLKEIVEILSANKTGLNCTYVGKNYTKQDLIDDLFALRAIYPYFKDDFKHQSNIDLKVKEGYKTKTEKRRDAIVKRDGSNCFYCGVLMDINEMTIEHLKAKSNGGKNNLKNLKVAHYRCNVEAGSLSVADKIKLRMKTHPLFTPKKVQEDNGFILDYSDYTLADGEE